MPQLTEKKYANGYTAKAIPGDDIMCKPLTLAEGEQFYQGKVMDPIGTILPVGYLDYMDSFTSFEPRKTDVWVMTFPKSGTTWMQELIWTILYNKDLDNKDAMLPLLHRTPFLEEDALEFAEVVKKLKQEHPTYQEYLERCPNGNPDTDVFVQFAEAAMDPRVVKTHLPFSFLNPKLLETAKIVYIARDPKSLLMSYYSYIKLLTFYHFEGTFDELIDLFLQNKLPFNNYWNHMREAWQKKDHPNVHFVFFEDLKQDMSKEVTRLAKFLEVDLTEKQLENVNFWCSFGEMKKRGTLGFDSYETAGLYKKGEETQEPGQFFRKGTGTDWKEKLTDKHLEMIKEWTKKNAEGFGPDFPYTKVD